ncbi:MAG: N-methylhydantoinase [Conexibacter sp.]|nr:N-methylhydantoinase [Conexibacter sp.]
MSISTSREFDVIDTEVHQKSVRNIANEMAITLMRTSGSPVVTEAKDFSTAILDRDGEQLAFSGHVTFHISTSVMGVEAVLRECPVEDVRPGDAFMCNDPHTSGAIHQGDVGIVMPYYYGDEHIGWGYVNEHVLDIGGSAVSGFAPGARDSYSESLAFPATRVVTGGQLDPQWESFIATNVRMPGTVLNDIRSMIAANNVGQQRLVALIDRIGLERFRELNEYNKQLSDAGVRSVVASLPDGAYESEDWVEYDARGTDDLFNVRTRLVVDGDELTIQFRGDPQADAFINGARPSVIGQAWTTLVAQLFYDIPVNAGIWRAIHFDLGPEGTVVNSVAPAPVTQSHMETGMRINKMLVDVLSQACALSTDPTVAARVAGQPAQNLALFSAFGIDRRSGQPVVSFPASMGTGVGGGGQTVTDGLDTYGCQAMTGCGVADVEIDETANPGMVLWRKVAPNSGGAGTFRGGMGIDMALCILHSDKMTGGAFTSCAQVPPRGSAGGYAGAAGEWRIVRESNVIELLEQGILPTKERLQGRDEHNPSKEGALVLQRGDVFISVNGGGGGVGDPLLRDADEVRADVENGYVTSRQAAELYGVVLDEGGRVAPVLTEQARVATRARRIASSPERSITADVPFAPLLVEDGVWSCAACAQTLADATGNWRDGAVTVETPVVDRYRELELRVRFRADGPPVVIRENFCPGCGTSLAVDITLEGRDPVPAPQLGVSDLWE